MKVNHKDINITVFFKPLFFTHNSAPKLAQKTKKKKKKKKIEKCVMTS